MRLKLGFPNCKDRRRPIRYFRNRPRLGQNANVNSLFLSSAGTHLVLLHDDDLLTPVALETLVQCWKEYPDLTAAFGKQFILSPRGKVDLKASEVLNRTYCRTPPDAGLQEPSWRVGLSQQFPNNGYMIRAEAARDTLWRSIDVVGHGGDFDFGLRLGLRYSKFVFVDVYTSCYRLTPGPSISSSSKDDAALYSFRITRDVPLPEEASSYRTHRLKEFAPRATRRRSVWVSSTRLGLYSGLNTIHGAGVSRLEVFGSFCCCSCHPGKGHSKVSAAN